MFKDFNRAGHKLLSGEIAAELIELGKRHGLTFTLNGGALGTDNLTFKVVATTGDTKALDAVARKKIDVYGRQYGLDGESYGTVFTSNGKRYRFTGIEPSRHKFPISGECMSTGKALKFTAGVVRLIIDARCKAAAVEAAAAARAPEKHDDRYAEMAQF